MNMIPVISSNVSAVGYDETTHIMRVRFHSGKIYDYCEVDKQLYESMLLPHCWSRLGKIVMRHRHRRIY